MKAIIEFNLPEDQENFELISKAQNYQSLVFEFDQWLRGEIKYGEKNELGYVRDKLYEMAAEEDITIV